VLRDLLDELDHKPREQAGNDRAEETDGDQVALGVDEMAAREASVEIVAQEAADRAGDESRPA
jgi:hypothetical protein